MGAEKRPRGEMERRTRKMIRAMRLAGTAEEKMLVEQAISGARIIDEAMADGGKRYIIPVGHRLQRDALAALRALAAAAPPAPEPVAVDDPRDDLTLWVAAIHRGSVVCQDAFPLVVAGECAQCDAAVVARAVYARRHPEVPRHEYGFGRADCGCAPCVAAEAAAANDP